MIQISDILAVTKQLTDRMSASNIQGELQNLTKAKLQVSRPQSAMHPALAIIDKLIAIVESLVIGPWTIEQEEVLKKLEISHLIGASGKQYLIDIKDKIKTSPSNTAAYINNAVIELTKLRTKPSQFLTLLQPFATEEKPSFILKKDEGVIEIIFDGDVNIDDFSEAKKQMDNWFIIIEGYTRLLGARREEFEIISMSKSSPAKFKIKTSLKNTTIVLGIVSSVFLIQKTVLENIMLIEKLKQRPIISDTTFYKQIIDRATAELDERVNIEIDKLVNKKMEEHKIPDGNGDIKVALSKGIEYQYNFVVNGGNVNIHLINGELQQQVDTLELQKDEIKQIKENYENQKALNATNDTTLKDNK